jgi:hypothetical protein
MGASMGLGQLALGLWLIIKGLGEGRHPAGAQVTSGGGMSTLDGDIEARLAGLLYVVFSYRV